MHPRISLLFSLLLYGATSYGQNLDTEDLGAGYAHLLSVVAQPEIAISGVDIDTGNEGFTDTSLDGLHIPYYKEFGHRENGYHWYIQASAGYAEYSQKGNVDYIPDLPTDVEAEWSAYNGLVEGGVVFPLGEGFSLATGLSLGAARLENELSFSEPFYEEILDPSFDGVLYNWDTNAALYRAHGALRYDNTHGDYRVKGVAHLTYSYIDSFNESGAFAGFADDSGAAILLLDVSRDIYQLESGKPVYLIGHLGSTHFLGGNRDQLGFNHYHEVGMSLGVSKYAAGVLFLWGEDADGVSLTFNYNY